MKPPFHHAQIRLGSIEGVHAETLCSARSFGRHWHDSFGFGVLEGGVHRSAGGRGHVEAIVGHIVTFNPGWVDDGIPLDKAARRWRMIHVAPATMARLVDHEGVEFSRPDFRRRHAPRGHQPGFPLQGRKGHGNGGWVKPAN